VPRPLRPLLLSLLALVVAACGQGPAEPAAAPTPDERPLVVTTVAPITNIAANIIGERASIVGAVPPGSDSHTYEPPPSLARLLSDADVVFLNGLRLEEPILALAAANRGPDATIVEIGDVVVSPDEYRFDFSFPTEEGMPNPHLWTDPTLVKGYAEVIRDTMTGVDPDGADHYQRNHDDFVAIVDDFDAALRQALDTVPPANRKLVTYHDSFPYFAERYGWEVLGAVQPADFGEPSAREVAALIEQVRQHDIPAIFGSEEFPSPVIEQIGREAGVRYVDTLADDVLPGRPGDAEHSWLGMLRQNYATIVGSLGGDPAALDGFEVRSVGPDVATYIR
jgi:ABC-type Zn uptake system ZnuABC Zn-binding protein ZnuA